MQFRVLKGVMDVQVRDGRRVLILWPTGNRPQKAFTKAKNKHVTGLKQHYTHEVYPVNKAQAHRGTMR